MATILTAAFAFGSAVWAFENKFLLIGAVLMFYVFIQALCIRRKRQKRLYRCAIYCAGKVFNIISYMDSGNRLIDPVSGTPVCIISLSVFLRMFPNEIPDGYYIDYSTIASSGKIFVFPPDKIKVGDITTDRVRLGVSMRNLEYDALLNGGIL